MAYVNDFSWSRTTNSDGSKTKWFSIVSYVFDHPEGVSKRQIVKHVWGSHSNHINISGYHSKTFACLHEDGLISYNPSTKKWYIGENLR